MEIVSNREEVFEELSLLRVQEILDKIKELKIVFCLPGVSWSMSFLSKWDKMQNLLLSGGVKFHVSRGYDPVIFFARNKILMGRENNGNKQEIFQGEIPCSHTFWIDNDTLPDPFMILKLLELGIEYPIISGLVRTREDAGYNAFTEKHSDSTRYYPMSWDQIMDYSGGGPFKCTYTGFSFTVIQKEVYQAVGYPWFKPALGKVVNSKDPKDWIVAMNSEDASFCRFATKAGYDTYAAPRVIAGHEKRKVLW